MNIIIIIIITHTAWKMVKDAPNNIPENIIG